MGAVGGVCVRGMDMRLSADLRRGGERVFTSRLALERRPWSDPSLARVLVRYPLMPSRVLGLIHWQAFRLWLKRTPFYRKPPHVPGQGSVRS